MTLANPVESIAEHAGALRAGTRRHPGDVDSPPWPPPRSLLKRWRAALPDLRRAYTSSLAWLESLKVAGIRDEIRRDARIALQEAKEDLLGMERAVAGLEKLYEDLRAGRPICRHWYDSAPCTCPRGPRSLRERLVLVKPRPEECPLLAGAACG